MKYTALEILELAGIENASQKIGKVRVRIAGIRGINNPDHIINIQEGETQVVVGDEHKTFTLPKRAKVSDRVRAALDKKGQAVLARQKAQEEAKAKKEDK